MKKTSLLLFSLTIMTLLITACGSTSATTPTISPDNVNNTAVAAAFTIIALTHEALPTETLSPSTDIQSNTPVFTDTPPATSTPESEVTHSPTFTVTPEPTFTVTFAPTATIVNDAACNNIIKTVADNRHTKIKLLNQSKFPVNMTIYLNRTGFGDCGYRVYSLAKGAQILITDLPLGCYNASAFIEDPKKRTSAFAYGCITNVDIWTFQVYDTGMYFAGP